MLEPDLSWSSDNFESVRGEVTTDRGAYIAARSLVVCRRCGALVPRYSAAYHLDWHERNTHSSPAAD